MSKPMTPRDALENLIELLCDQTLAKSDQEIRTEATEEFGDVSAHVQQLRNSVKKRVAAHRKVRLKRAQAAVQETRALEQTSFSHRSLPELKATVRQLLARRKDIPQRLTLAFRNGEEMSDEDWASLIEDLTELGFLSEDKE